MTDTQFKKLYETCVSDLAHNASINYAEHWKSKTGQKDVDPGNIDYSIEIDLEPGDFYLFALCEEYNNNQSERSAISLSAIINVQSSRMKQVLERIKEELHEEFKYKIIAYSL